MTLDLYVELLLLKSPHVSCKSFHQETGFSTCVLSYKSVPFAYYIP